MKLRSPVVAGRFYPADKRSLEAELKSFIRSAPKVKNAFAIISPHAGYVYSGKTAGSVYSSIDVPDLVFVLSPNHTGLGSPISLDPSEVWSTPLGDINADLDIVKKIKEKVPQAEIESSAQQMEHALEVQLPFIQLSNPKARIVPITLSGFTFPVIQKLGIAISEIIIDEEKKSGKRPLIVASSDMTHFEDADSARKKDMLAMEQIKRLDTQNFLRTVDENQISLCGYYTISVMMEAAIHYSQKTGSKITVDLVDYTNSGLETGDYNEVVAYAGLILHG